MGRPELKKGTPRMSQCVSVRTKGRIPAILAIVVILTSAGGRATVAQIVTPVPLDQRGRSDAERAGTHDAANLRTVFWNFGMVGDYPPDPGNVDLSVLHSVEVPKGSGMNYSDGITPFVLAKVQGRDGHDIYAMETGFRERQAISPSHNRVMRFEPRPGYFQADPAINLADSPAMSHDARTWPHSWPDRLLDPDDPGWVGKWNGYFGKRPAADQESYTVMDDQYYDAWNFRPDSRDSTRYGLGLRVEVRGFQWSNPQAGNVIFWHYDITNEGTTDYNDNIIFGLYMDSGVGGSALSCDNIYESDDDNAYFNRRFGDQVINLVYTWDNGGHGRDLSGNCARTGYLGYAYLETPGNSTDGIDNDEDGITDELRDGGPGEKIVGQDAIRTEISRRYNMARFVATYGPLEKRPAYQVGLWWTGDEDLDWNAEFNDTGADGIFGTQDTGERDGIPTAGEPNFDRTDLHESDQIGLTGFKFNRIKAGQGNPSTQIDDIVFYDNPARPGPKQLYERFTSPDSATRFDAPLANNYNIGFLFASGPFRLPAGKTERFSLALAYGGDLDELRRTVQTVQLIYNANYQFAEPPPMPTATAEVGDGFVRLSWDDIAERGRDAVTGENDFEGYRIYRSTDPDFRDPRIIMTGTGSNLFGNGRPIAQFDLVDGRRGYSERVEEGVAYYLGADTGIKHTWADSTVTNGQMYYYAVTSYDYGPKAAPGVASVDSMAFYPSENPISVSKTLRGGVILPPNVVAVRPEPKVLGYTPAGTEPAVRVAGQGVGTVDVQVVNSNLVPDGHLFAITFQPAGPESLRAASYTLRDSSAQATLFTTGRDLRGEGIGPVGSGLLPIVNTLPHVEVDAMRSGFSPESRTDARFDVSYQEALPINLRRPGFPDDLTIFFSDTVQDTSLAAIGLPATPVKFKVIAHGAEGDRQLDLRFYDIDPDGRNGPLRPNGLLDRQGEYIEVMTYAAAQPRTPRATWRFGLADSSLTPPGEGDEFRLVLRRPFGADDVYVLRSRGQRTDLESGRAEDAFHPYVVPNPYVAAAAFEPERFAVSGRGDRRIEFRGLPQDCVIRIYSVRGDLVQTLEHNGSNDGFVAWNLRTKDNLDVAPGLYIYHVDGGTLGTRIGKFAIIK
jgi:hypothetical protein